MAAYREVTPALSQEDHTALKETEGAVCSGKDMVRDALAYGRSSCGCWEGDSVSRNRSIQFPFFLHLWRQGPAFNQTVERQQSNSTKSQHRLGHGQGSEIRNVP